MILTAEAVVGEKLQSKRHISEMKTLSFKSKEKTKKLKLHILHTTQDLGLSPNKTENNTTHIFVVSNGFKP